MATDEAVKRPLAFRVARMVGRVSLGVIALVGILAGVVYAKTESAIHQTMRVRGEDMVIPTDADSVARGERLATTSGCLECHGSNGAGRMFLNAMPVVEVRTPNLTPAGPTARWSGRDWARAVRHGVRPDGSVLLFMPCRDYRFLGDADLGAIVAYLKTLPPVRHDAGRTRVGPVGRVLYLKGDLPLITAELIDHDAPVPATPTPGPTAEYGAYLAHACTGCHGEHFSGGPIPGVPPDWPPSANLTPDPSGLRDATEAQFVATLTTGARRRGGTIDSMQMPWRQLARLTEDERHALWLYLRTLPARPAGGR